MKRTVTEKLSVRAISLNLRTFRRLLQMIVLKTPLKVEGAIQSKNLQHRCIIEVKFTLES